MHNLCKFFLFYNKDKTYEMFDNVYFPTGKYHF